jgi:hypothetical protein
MTRPQLLVVAEALNAKLPAALRIDINPSSSTDSFIRNAIELIVGIKRTVPGAPKATKLGVSSVADPDKSVSPPTSPLASKTRPRDIYQANPRLAAIKEEDEDTVTVVDKRPVKKRRVSGQTEVPDTKKRRVFSQPTVQIGRTRSTRITPALNNELHRSRSQRIPTSQISPPRSSRVLRSQSQKLPTEMMKIEVDTAFITMQRPRYRSRTKTALTPRRKSRDELQMGRGEGSVERMASLSNSSIERSVSSTSVCSKLDTTLCGNVVLAKSEAAAAAASESDRDEEDDANVVFGMRGMTMSTSHSGMDIDIR